MRAASERQLEMTQCVFSLHNNFPHFSISPDTHWDLLAYLLFARHSVKRNLNVSAALVSFASGWWTYFMWVSYLSNDDMLVTIDDPLKSAAGPCSLDKLCGRTRRRRCNHHQQDELFLFPLLLWCWIAVAGSASNKQVRWIAVYAWGRILCIQKAGHVALVSSFVARPVTLFTAGHVTKAS